MSKRAARSSGGSGAANKRRRTKGEQAAPVIAASLGNLNSDCKVHILSYLPAEDMNSFAMCGQDCRRVRANESLDQTRTGTIIWTENTTFDSFCNIMRESAHIFAGNRTRLKIVGIEHFFWIFSTLENYNAPHLQEVRSLDCSFSKGRSLGVFSVSALSGIFPNLQEIDLSNTTSAYAFGRPFLPSVTKITWTDSRSLWLCGSDFRGVANLTHLVLDTSTFRALGKNLSVANFCNHPSSFMFMKCSRLERVSLKGATMKHSGKEEDEPIPLFQELLINMVRRHPSFSWLRSDLTAENIAMLKQERPEIAFVSD